MVRPSRGRSRLGLPISRSLPRPSRVSGLPVSSLACLSVTWIGGRFASVGSPDAGRQLLGACATLAPGSGTAGIA